MEMENNKIEYENLTEWVNSILTNLGHENPSFWEYRKAVVTEVKPGEPLPELMQIIQINRAIRYLFAECELNTFDIRMLIIDTDDVNEWKTYMENNILPFIVRNRIQ